MDPSWRQQGCHKNPPQDVAHLQFKSRIAFKLVWCPPSFRQFVLVDDDGNLLTYGQPDEDNLPHIRHRQMNYMHVENSKYGKNAFERQLDTAEMRDEGVEEVKTYGTHDSSDL